MEVIVMLKYYNTNAGCMGWIPWESTWMLFSTYNDFVEWYKENER